MFFVCERKEKEYQDENNVRYIYTIVSSKKQFLLHLFNQSNFRQQFVWFVRCCWFHSKVHKWTFRTLFRCVTIKLPTLFFEALRFESNVFATFQKVIFNVAVCNCLWAIHFKFKKNLNFRKPTNEIFLKWMPYKAIFTVRLTFDFDWSNDGASYMECHGR